LADKIKYEFSRVPGELDPIQIPVGYADLNGDESEFGLKVSGAAGGGGGTTLGTPHTTAVDVTDAAAIPVVAANNTRLSLLIINNSVTDAVYLRGDGDATPDKFSIKVVAGGSFSTDKTGAAYTAITETGKTASLTVEEIATTWP
jgi:hypothetical protein